MRARFAVVTLGLLLTIASLGCTKKTEDQTSQTNSTDSSMANQSPNQNQAEAPSAGAPMREQRREEAKQEQPKREEPKPIVIPSGTTLTVHIGQSLSSKTSQTGQSFTASLAQPVSVGGTTVIPEGASASGTVVDAKSAGRFKGESNLQITLTSVTVNGSPMQIQTSSFSQGQKGKGKRTAGLIGGGAGAGALIGGLAGGGKG